MIDRGIPDLEVVDPCWKQIIQEFYTFRPTKYTPVVIKPFQLRVGITIILLLDGHEDDWIPQLPITKVIELEVSTRTRIIP